jgi:hypothetical protein
VSRTRILLVSIALAAAAASELLTGQVLPIIGGKVSFALPATQWRAVAFWL